MKFKSEVQLEALNNATTDTDKFLVSDSSTVKYRTGAEVLSDIGAQPLLTNPITGSGITNYLPKFTGASALGNSSFFDNGSIDSGITNASYSQFILKGSGTNDTGGGVLKFSNQTKDFAQITGETESASNGMILFRNLRSGTITESMRITSGGNVGIGTTSPAVLLDLYKTSFPVAQISSGTITGNMGIDTSNNFMSFGTSTNHDVSFATNNTPRMRITSGGNVGIGTTSPGEKLSVSGNDQSGLLSLLALENFISTNPANGNGVAIDFRLNNSGNPSYVCGKIGLVNTFYRSNTDMTFSVANSDTLSERMRITSSGNVGIGTTSPNALLDVAGDALINGVTVGAGPSNIATNTVVGHIAGSSLTTGAGNIFIGKYSGSLATDCNNSTVIGGYLSPSKVGFNESDTLSIEKPDSELNSHLGESAGLPHIWSPKTVVITDNTNAILVSMKSILYSSIFMEYNLEDTNGNMRAGSIKAIWNADASTIKVTEETTDSIGTTSGCVIELVQDGVEYIIVRFTNANGYNAYCNTTSRILIRPTIQIL